MTAHSLPSLPPLIILLREATGSGRGFCGALGILAILSLISFAAPASAAIFKCVSAAGDTTYTSTPCAHDESTRRISNTAAAVAGLDCRIARKLAFDTTRRMKQGETSASVFDSHGGMDSLSPLVMGLISYIYTFDGNDKVSANRIATLATERCQVGSFGANARRCEVYPYEFLEQLGGCDAARDESRSAAEQTAAGQTRALPGADLIPATGTATPASYEPPAAVPAVDTAAQAAAARAIDARSNCRQRLNQTLENTNTRMQNGASTAEQERLRAQQRQLRMQLARC